MKRCADLFYNLEWTYPTTLLEEWDSNGYFGGSRAGMTVTIKWNGISLDRKYKITYSGKITGKTPNYMSLRAHLKASSLKWNEGMVESTHVLHCISSFIDDFTFKVRNSRCRGDILAHYEKGLSVTTAPESVPAWVTRKVILTVSFTPLKHRATI